MIHTRTAGDLDPTEQRVVAANPVLGCLAAADLLGLVRRSTLLMVDARDVVFGQGEAGPSVLIVLHGHVKLSLTTAGGREAILDVAGPGDLFGEVAVLNGWPRAADAVALSPCRLLSIDGQQAIQALQGAPASLLALIRLLSGRLRTATEQMTDAVGLPAPARVAKALTYLAALHSRTDRLGLHIEFQLSQRELGALTGLTRESINKHLANFRDCGAIRMSGQDITILDLPQLRQAQLG